jgi:uncharacterized GH25 family protein
MKRRFILALALLVASATVAYGHDLFVKMDSYFVEPHSSVTIPILNGVFDKSENAIMADRLLDISIMSGAGRIHIDTAQWAGDTTLADTTFLTVDVGEPGTYIVGASTRARDLALAGADFNEYLEHDGIPDVLQARADSYELEKDVVEKYEKHVKGIFQVGDRPDRPKAWWQFWKDDSELAYLTPLGYPAEIIPLVNPYLLAAGDSIQVRCLVDGNAASNQYIMIGGEGSSGVSFPVRNSRTDADGVATFRLNAPGKWYLEFINMVPSREDGIDYHSKWATLTFAIR